LSKYRFHSYFHFFIIAKYFNRSIYVIGLFGSICAVWATYETDAYKAGLINKVAVFAGVAIILLGARDDITILIIGIKNVVIAFVTALIAFIRGVYKKVYPLVLAY
jgi:hypothetical protein